MSSLLDKMVRIRAIELEIAKRYHEGKMRTPVHLSVGQEAVAVGVCAALNPGDQVVSTHRGHAHYLAMGGSLDALIAELYGKGTGCSGGYGGSMHLVDRSVGFMGSTSIVGGTIPIGVGLAFAKKLRKEPGVVVIFHGDAAVEEGVWHESMNFASLHELPVIFLCENNLCSCFTDINDRQPKNRPLTILASGHYVETMIEISTDPEEIMLRAQDARYYAEKCGPIFLEIETHRYLEHCGPNNDDHLNYRDLEYLKKWKEMDPIKDMIPSPEVMEEIRLAFERAEAAPIPELVSAYAN